MSFLFKIVMLALVPLSALAEADGPDFYRVVDVREGSALNLRAAPTIGAARVGRIPAGTDGLPNKGCVGGLTFEEWSQADAQTRAASRKTRWCRTAYQGIDGWAAGWHLAEGSAGS